MYLRGRSEIDPYLPALPWEPGLELGKMRRQLVFTKSAGQWALKVHFTPLHFCWTIFCLFCFALHIKFIFLLSRIRRNNSCSWLVSPGFNCCLLLWWAETMADVNHWFVRVWVLSDQVLQKKHSCVYFLFNLRMWLHWSNGWTYCLHFSATVNSLWS